MAHQRLLLRSARSPFLPTRDEHFSSSPKLQRSPLSQPFLSTRTSPQGHRTISATTKKYTPPQTPSKSKPKPAPENPGNPSIPTGNLKDILKDLKGPTRWIVICSFLVLASAETTFWIQVIHAKFFADEDDAAASEFLERCKEALAGFRRAWLPNYQSYYASSIWGL
jgi:hypothetical protein